MSQSLVSKSNRTRRKDITVKLPLSAIEFKPPILLAPRAANCTTTPRNIKFDKQNKSSIVIFEP